MATIRPFHGLRFDPQKAGDLREVTCPPYDIISDEQRQAYLRANEHNVIRLELPREGENPYQQAGEVLKSWMEEGILRQDEQESYYIYEEEFVAYGRRAKIRGLICLVELTPFSEGVVLPHEETLSKAKTDRFNLMKSTFCNFSQIYSLYMDNSTTRPLIDSLAEGTPAASFADEAGVINRLWTVTDPETVAQLIRQFEGRKLYIADGHHRYETALNFRNALREQGLTQPGHPADYCMMMLVDMEHPGLVVFPTHRIVRDLPEYSQEAALEACGEYFEVSKRQGLASMESELTALYDDGKKAFGFYSGGNNWHLLVLKDMDVIRNILPDCSAALQGLDVTVLHSLVLERIFGIDKENMANQKNLTYTRDFQEAIDAVRGGQAQCSFILNPTRVTEIRDVAAAGEKMPQKSTYFYPKLITGLVMNRICDPIPMD